MAGRSGVLLGGFVLAMGHGPALAQPRPVSTIDQQALVPALDIAAVRPALAVASANQVTSVDADGVEFIRATAANGLVFEVHFTACEEAAPVASPQGCKALYLTAIWGGVDPARRAELDAIMASFLAQNPLVNAATLDDSSPYLLRYVIADYGIPQGNLLSEFGNFVGIATAFHNQVSGLLSQ